jgi:hypothetical protein
METTEKSGKLKLTVELEVNPALMELAKENMANMMEMAKQWRPSMGSGGKMGEGNPHGMGNMMHHGQQ